LGFHGINEQRLVKMSALFDRALAVVVDLAAPEEGLTFFIDGLEFKPHIEGVDGAPGEKVTDLARANDDIYPHIIAAPHGRIHTAQGCGDGSGLACGAVRQSRFRFFTHRKGSGQLRPTIFGVVATEISLPREKSQKYPR